VESDSERSRLPGARTIPVLGLGVDRSRAFVLQLARLIRTAHRAVTGVLRGGPESGQYPAMSWVSEADALRLALEECPRRGLPWREPIAVRGGWREWRVYSPSNVRGGNTIVTVRRRSGKVKVRHYDR
jgi:hypothetical protein